ncbi:hypothetical protein ACJX0J_019864, partial [Zea mays]
NINYTFLINENMPKFDIIVDIFFIQIMLNFKLIIPFWSSLLLNTKNTETLLKHQNTEICIQDPDVPGSSMKRCICYVIENAFWDNQICCRHDCCEKQI